MFLYLYTIKNAFIFKMSYNYPELFSKNIIKWRTAIFVDQVGHLTDDMLILDFLLEVGQVEGRVE